MHLRSETEFESHPYSVILLSLRGSFQRKLPTVTHRCHYDTRESRPPGYGIRAMSEIYLLLQEFPSDTNNPDLLCLTINWECIPFRTRSTRFNLKLQSALRLGDQHRVLVTQRFPSLTPTAFKTGEQKLSRIALIF